MPRPATAVEKAVTLHEEVADTDLRQHLIEPGVEAALRKPDASGLAPEPLGVVVDRDLNLRPDRRRLMAKERQIAVSGGARDDLHMSEIL